MTARLPSLRGGPHRVGHGVLVTGNLRDCYRLFHPIANPPKAVVVQAELLPRPILVDTAKSIVQYPRPLLVLSFDCRVNV